MWVWTRQTRSLPHGAHSLAGKIDINPPNHDSITVFINAMKGRKGREFNKNIWWGGPPVAWGGDGRWVPWECSLLCASGALPTEVHPYASSTSFFSTPPSPPNSELPRSKDLSLLRLSVPSAWPRAEHTLGAQHVWAEWLHDRMPAETSSPQRLCLGWRRGQVWKR